MKLGEPRIQVTTVTVGETNCYFVQKANQVVLVDAGPPGAEKKLIPAAEAAGIRPEMVKLIFITHSHLDHYGAAAALKAWCGAPVAAHVDAPALSRDKRFALPRAQTLRGTLIRWVYLLLAPLLHYAPLEADLALAEDDTLDPYGLEARVLRLPGHAPDSLGFITPAGQAFVGDLVVNYGLPSQPLYLHSKQDWRASYDRLLALKPHMVYVGHGDPFSGDQLAPIHPARYQWRWWVR